MAQVFSVLISMESNALYLNTAPAIAFEGEKNYFRL